MQERLWVRRYRRGPSLLVALHGFTQTGGAFNELAALLPFDLIAPDLPGHGRSAGYPTSFAAAVEGVAGLLAAGPIPVPLLGYSQGGRVALAATLEHPSLVSHLILVSASPGIGDALQRAARSRSDRAQAERMEAGDLGVFLEDWISQPMFAGLMRRGVAWQKADLAMRFENTTAGLAAALVGMGQGAQPYLGDRLEELRVPVLLLAGERDTRYMAVAKAMSRRIRTATFRSIPDCGHAVIGEQPAAAAGYVAEFLPGSA